MAKNENYFLLFQIHFFEIYFRIFGFIFHCDRLNNYNFIISIFKTRIYHYNIKGRLNNGQTFRSKFDKFILNKKSNFVFEFKTKCVEYDRYGVHNL